jgi:hypothetical protein
MNNVNMGGMNAMGGPVGGAMPMMNSGAPGSIIRPPMPANDNQRQQLNTYIYEYFIRNGMFDCARSLLNSEQPLKIIKESPGRQNNGNGVGNGTGEDGGDGESKDDPESKRPDDLPAPDVPRECPESCFLYEWWCLFWDMFNAQRGKGDGRNVLQYVNHTQVCHLLLGRFCVYKLTSRLATIALKARSADPDDAPDDAGSVSANDADEPAERHGYEPAR